MATTYDSIASTTLGSNTSLVSISNIPQTYTDLILITETYNTSGAFLQYLELIAGGGLYSGNLLRGAGSGAAIGTSYTNDNVVLADSPVGMNSSSSIYGHYIYHIMDYTNTTTFKTVLSRFTGANDSISGAFMYRGTSAITSLVINVGGGSFLAGSTFSLYGIKAL